MLRLSMDEEMDDDDVQGEAQSLPFVIDELLFGQYGNEFSINLDESGTYTVIPRKWKIAPLKATRFSV